MFVDEITVEVYGGKGGDGVAVFRREKYVELGGPWGGNGGHGGSVIFVGDEGKSTLIDLRYMRHIKAKPGERGRTKGQHGAWADNTYVKVPLGTVVYTEDKSMKIGEITKHGEELIVAQGGKGGRGNIAFATHKNPAPDYAENGDPGVHRKIVVELKVLADVGLIGYPSVGKSTLLSVVSNAKPKIAAYPFTTLHPNLGMVEVGDSSYVLADLPGLIENAHLGLGLGIRFLKHIERCRIFLHVVDLTRDDPYEDYIKINHELEMYDEELLKRPQIVVANKVDIPGNEEKLEVLKKHIQAPLIVISAHMRKDVDQLLYKTLEVLKEAPKVEEKTPLYVRNYTLEAEEPDFIITKQPDGSFDLTGSKLKLIFDRTDFTKEEAVKRFARQLRSLGIDEALRKEGAKNHDTVRIFTYEFEFIE
ncbi:MAG TPA: GTPase ObgE [Acholeplasmataceae bacterium]|nr:GTPase ObgE [Acholeplasmataceae bacterium]